MSNSDKEGEYNNDYNETINILSLLIKRSGVPQAKLSRCFGKSDNYISHIINKQFKVSLLRFIEILDIFGISISSFFSDSFRLKLKNRVSSVR